LERSWRVLGPTTHRNAEFLGYVLLQTGDMAAAAPLLRGAMQGLAFSPSSGHVMVLGGQLKRRGRENEAVAPTSMQVFTVCERSE